PDGAGARAFGLGQPGAVDLRPGALRPVDYPPIRGGAGVRAAGDQAVRHPGRERQPASRFAFRRQPAESGRRPRARAPAQGPAGQPAHPRPGRGVDRIHPPPDRGPARRRPGRAADLVGARRNPLPRRSGGGDVPGPDRGHPGGGRHRPRAHRPADGGRGMTWRRLFRPAAVALAAQPILSIVFGFAVAGLAVLASGADPVQAFSALFQGAFTNPRAFTETMIATLPYLFLGLAVALGFKAGLFNIGAEGQFYLGALFGVFIGYSVQGLPGIVHVPLALLAGMLGGFLWAAIPGIIKARTGAHEVIITIMLNYVAFQLT